MSSYLVLEGGDGAGKSHQARLLRGWLLQRGLVVQHLREPGSTPTGEAIRKLLLARETGELAPWTEALLFYAARAELIRRHLRPALARGELVLVERCYLSTMVYQGLAIASAEPVSLDLLDQITAVVHGDTMPDRIFVLDVDAETRQQRSQDKHDRFEARSDDYHQRVRDAYLQLAERDPQRVQVVDASGSVQDVQAELRRRCLALLEGGGRA